MTAAAPFSRLLVVHRGQEIERDLIEYAAWLATLSAPATVHVLAAPVQGLLHTFAPVVRAIFARRGLTRVSMEALIERDLDELFEAAIARDADLLVMRPPSASHAAGPSYRQSASRLAARRIAARLWTDAPCSVWTVPAGAAPSMVRALVDLSHETRGPSLLEHAARLCARADSDDLIALQACFRDVRMSDEELEARFLRERLLAMYRVIHRVPLHGVPCTPIVGESPRVHRALLHAARTHHADLLIVSPDAEPPGPWQGAPHEVIDFLMACDVPLLQIRLTPPPRPLERLRLALRASRSGREASES